MACRQLGEFASTGDFAISAHDGPESRAEALEAGCDEYVTKPIDFDRLNALLGRFVKKSHS